MIKYVEWDNQYNGDTMRLEIADLHARRYPPKGKGRQWKIKHTYETSQTRTNTRWIRRRPCSGSVGAQNTTPMCAETDHKSKTLDAKRGEHRQQFSIPKHQQRWWKKTTLVFPFAPHVVSSSKQAENKMVITCSIFASSSFFLLPTNEWINEWIKTHQESRGCTSGHIAAPRA